MTRPPHEWNSTDIALYSMGKMDMTDAEYFASYGHHMYDEKSQELDEARADIERLETEVALEKHKFTESEKVWVKAIDTAWNDAIEAAAKTHEESGCCHASRYATAIRALKRSQT